jgi:amino acid transporter
MKWISSPFAAKPPDTSEPKSGLGTFGGVYTPSILTILGVIMYLRMGWVVGNVGLTGALVIITLSTSITFLTSLSISEIATDRVVRGGGAYYMISRSLGIEVGGAVGIPLYIAQTLSISLYTIGFGESVALAFPLLDQRLVACLATVLVAGLAVKSASFAIRTQYLIMAAIVLSLLSFILGQPLPMEGQDTEVASVITLSTAPFWEVFALFFPAVTGIMAGVSMSGDLREPTRSIPIGTLAAVSTGYVIYIGLAILLAERADASTLVTDSLVMQRIAYWGPAILIGVWGATLSSALGSILAAPRILQALAKDRVLPNWLRGLASGSGPEEEPRLGTLVTLLFALVATALGNLNLIAPVLTMFFLTNYLVLNLAAAIESFLKSPSFRPSFPVHWSISLLGALGCLVVMFLIEPIATILATVIVLGTFSWLKQRSLKAAWGDIRKGLVMTIVREGILQLSPHPDPESWRPHLLVFSGSPTRRWHLIELADALTQNRSLMTAVSILHKGSLNALQLRSMQTTVTRYLQNRGVRALAQLVRAPDIFSGAEWLVETYGLGPLVPDTILLGPCHEQIRRERYCQFLAHAHRSNRNILILRKDPKKGFGQHRRIDVWWGGLQTNGGLMLILAHLLQNSEAWKGAEVQLKMVVKSEVAAQAVQVNLNAVIEQLRMNVKPMVLVSTQQSIDAMIRNSSLHADLVFLGMARPYADYAHYYEKLQARAIGLPTTLFVLAAPDFAFSDILSS